MLDVDYWGPTFQHLLCINVSVGFQTVPICSQIVPKWFPSCCENVPECSKLFQNETNVKHTHSVMIPFGQAQTYKYVLFECPGWCHF